MVCSFYHSRRLAKKVILFPEIGWVKMFLSLTSPLSQMCIIIYISNFLKKKRDKKKLKKRVYLENLTVYHDIACECALCTFNLLD